MARLDIVLRVEQNSFAVWERIILRDWVPNWAAHVWFVWKLNKEDDPDWWRKTWPPSI